MAKIHAKYLEDLFSNKDVVYTSSELIKRMREEFRDCTSENARKIVQNSVKSGIIKSTNPVTFGHNQYAYYGAGFNLSIEMIKAIIKENRPGLHRVVKRMNENKGVISYFEAFKLSASLTKNTTTKVNTLSQLVKILEQLKIAEPKREHDSGTLYLVSYEMEESEAINKMRDDVRRLQLDCMFIPPFLNWLQKHNFISNKGLLYRNKNRPGDGAILNNLLWDAISFTNTVGFYEYIGDYSDEKKTLVVIDFKIINKYNSDDLHGFYDRIQIYRNSVTNKDNKRKILPIIVSNKITDEAKIEIKKLNCLSFNLGTIFGERIYEIIQSLELISFSDMPHDNDDYFINQISNILSVVKESGQEDNLGNLKGELFERLMDKVIRTVYSRDIKELTHSFIVNKTDAATKKKEGYEYDYLLETKYEFIVFELKGYSGFIKKGEYNPKTGKPNKNTIKWFFGLTYPFIKKELESNMGLFPKKVRACYITTGQFDKDALTVLENKNKDKDKPKGLDIYYDGKKLMELLKTHEMDKEIKVINQFYKAKTKYNMNNENGENAKIIQESSIEDLNNMFEVAITSIKKHKTL